MSYQPSPFNHDAYGGAPLGTGRRPRPKPQPPTDGQPTLAPDPNPPPPPPPRWQPGDPLPPSVMPSPPGYFKPDPNMPLRPDFGSGGINPNPDGVGRRPSPTAIVGRQPQRPTYGALSGLLG